METQMAITANGILVWMANGFFFGIGLALAWNLVGMPFRRWYIAP